MQKITNICDICKTIITIDIGNNLPREKILVIENDIHTVDCFPCPFCRVSTIPINIECKEQTVTRMK